MITALKERNSKNSGFTLIELLVVISIIGILATLLLANVAGVRERARDAQRKSDVNQIQKALEMYKNSLTTPSYPASGLSNLATALEGGSNPTMKKVPHDPKCRWIASSSTWDCTGWLDYSYTRDATDNLKYTLWVCLENKSDPQKDSNRGVTPPATCVSNCQTSNLGVCYSTTEL